MRSNGSSSSSSSSTTRNSRPPKRSNTVLSPANTPLVKIHKVDPPEVVDMTDDTPEAEHDEDTDDGRDSDLAEDLDSTEEEKSDDRDGDQNANTRNDPSLGLGKGEEQPDKANNPTIPRDHHVVGPNE